MATIAELDADTDRAAQNTACRQGMFEPGCLCEHDGRGNITLTYEDGSRVILHGTAVPAETGERHHASLRERML